jgi:hypothetical protein
MFGSQLPEAESATSAVLLVLLPLAADAPQFTFSPVAAATLERQLGGAVRVLTVDEASSPAVIRSFAPLRLPTCVLMHQGMELWRQPGLPELDAIAPVLLTWLMNRHP